MHFLTRNEDIYSPDPEVKCVIDPQAVSANICLLYCITIFRFPVVFNTRPTQFQRIVFHRENSINVAGKPDILQRREKCNTHDGITDKTNRKWRSAVFHFFSWHKRVTNILICIIQTLLRGSTHFCNSVEDTS